MTIRNRTWVAVLCVAGLWACKSGDDAPPFERGGQDAATAPSASDAGPDARVPDAGERDAAADGGGGDRSDGGTDASVADASGGSDAGADAGDAGSDAGDAMTDDGGDASLDAGGEPDLSLFVRDDTALSGLGTVTIAMLRAGSSSCSNVWLYPYDDTVLPRGSQAPLVMWSGGSFDGAYLRLRYASQSNVDYELAVAGDDDAKLTIPQDAWDRVLNRSTTNALVATLTVKVGANLSTCERTFPIAPGKLSGGVYYDTYAAPGALHANQGAIVRTKLDSWTSSIYLQEPGQPNAIASTGPCVSCHVLSADGSTLIAARHDYGGNALTKVFKFQSFAFAVSGTDSQPSPSAELPNATWAALLPNGTRALTLGNPQCTNGAETFPRAPSNMPYVSGPSVAKVIDTATGDEVASTGLDATWSMWMPRFSPDGKHVVFNHARPDGSGGTNRRDLAVLDYDASTNAFSNLRVIVSALGPTPSESYSPRPTLAGTITESCQPSIAGADQVATLPAGACTGPCYPAWPSFTPDGRGVVFALIDQPDFASAFPGRETTTRSELWYVDLPSGTKLKLDNANQGSVQDEAMQNYYPSVLPVAIGGRAWLFWSAKRTYGNRTFPDVPGNDDIANLSTAFARNDARNKRIWVSALRMFPEATDFPSDEDISSPGFFLDGQTDSGNLRPTAARWACMADASACRAGFECCGGYCKHDAAPSGDPDEAYVGTCASTAPACGAVGDRCTTAASCCAAASGTPANACVGGFCAPLE